MKKYKRWQKVLIEKALKSRRVLILAGARQCGKTTLAKESAMGGDVKYVTLDDLIALEIAKEDPHGFVEHGRDFMVIDEVQRVPELIIAIKKAVDEDTRMGQYLLTGSTNLQSIPQVKESLAGRVRTLRLRGLAQAEVVGAEADFFERAFGGQLDRVGESVSRKELIGLALRGGYPEVFSLESDEVVQWHRDYRDSILARDLKEFFNFERQNVMGELFDVLAAWSSKFMNKSDIARSLGVARATLDSYINALEALYLFESVAPWTKTDYDRVGRNSKMFMTDSGLMASTLGWAREGVEMDSDRVGKLVETYMFHQLASQVDVSGGKYRMYQYRDRSGREIDFLIEREDGALLGIEIKAGTGVKKDSFKHLRWFQENMVKPGQEFVGIVLYTGEQTYSFGKGLWAVPVGELLGGIDGVG